VSAISLPRLTLADKDLNESGAVSKNAPVDDTPSDSGPGNEVQLSINELGLMLQEECHRWQKILRLQDWNVHVQLCRAAEMPKSEGDGTDVGSIAIFGSAKDAVISLLAPIDFPGMAPSQLMPDRTNYDVTLVHELLHIHFDLFAKPANTPEGYAQEQVINVLSRAIVEAHSQAAVPRFPRVQSAAAGHYV